MIAYHLNRILGLIGININDLDRAEFLIFRDKFSLHNFFR